VAVVTLTSCALAVAAIAALLLIVLGRTVFWAITDLWADQKTFAWSNTRTKERGVAAGAVLRDAALV
jgi:hypothetical protein